jgi:type VI secretion system Hcp family effector
MANSFMQIPSIPAAGADDKGWIPIKSLAFSAKVEIGKFDKGRARPIDRCQHDVLTVKKPFDRSSLFVSIFCSQGRLLPAVNLAFSREDEKDIYLKCELKNVLISELEVEVDDGSDPEETLKLDYQSIEWKFRAKLKGGKLGEWMHVGWDRATEAAMTELTKV